MTAPPGDLHAAIEDIRSGVQQARQSVVDIIAGINSVLDLLPDIVIAGIRAAVAHMQRLAEEHFRWVEEKLAFTGAPDTLRAVGSTWTTGIGGPASGSAGASTWNTMQADDHWTGIAATAYRNTLPAQQGALLAVKATSDDVDSVLNELAGSITTFWIAISGALITLGTAMISAAVSAATVAGAPVAAGIAVASLVAFAAFAVTTVNAFTDATDQTATRAAELDRRLNDDGAFDGSGAWPRSTTEITGDGSITDGDGTDWRIIPR